MLSRPWVRVVEPATYKAAMLRAVGSTCIGLMAAVSRTSTLCHTSTMGRGLHQSRAVLAGYLGKKHKHSDMSGMVYLKSYSQEYWAMHRAKQFVHQPKPNTQAIFDEMFEGMPKKAKHFMNKSGLRWVEDDQGVKFLHERLEFLKDYLELNDDQTRRVIEGDYHLVQIGCLDLETDLKPIVRFLRKDLEFTNKEVGEMMCKCPSLLRGYIHEMKRVVKYMYHLGVPYYGIKRVCYKVPTVFHADIDVKTPKVLTIVRKVLPSLKYNQIVKHKFNRKRETRHQKD